MRLKQGSFHSGGGDRSLPFGAGVVNKDNFADKAIAFMRASGRTNGEHPVVKKDDQDDRQFWAWVAFWRQLNPGDKAGEFYKSQGLMTVPAIYPWDFSVDADGLRDISLSRRDFAHGR